ncbi:MAG: DUF3108 domain-containing protein [Proteobacteria bacterium]|nr:DUF3108 domain-containing protein [Pseudomonadota bacterium]
MTKNNYGKPQTGMLLSFLIWGLLCSAHAWGDALFDADGFIVLRASVPNATKMVHPGTSPSEALLQTAYGGGETLRYSVNWLGIKADELVMRVSKIEGSDETFSIAVTARSAGLLEVFYPVEDHFLTIVKGPMRLPSRHEMQQKEGSRVNSKLTLYDQEKFRVSYRKNDQPADIYQVEGTMQNEFSSFFLMRTLPFTGEAPVIVPTFADKKRHEVVVAMEGREEQESVLGKKNTIKVQPHLRFKGLYEKVGDPLIWLTDDAWRIPTKIQAKIVIGSLTAELIEYTGPAGKFIIIDTPKELPR